MTGLFSRLRGLACRHYRNGRSAWRYIRSNGDCTLYGCSVCGATRTVC